MLRQRPFAVLCSSFLLLAVLPALASGGMRTGAPSASGSFSTTITTQHFVIEVDQIARTVLVRDDETNEEVLLRIEEGVPLRAGKKSNFNGRKKLVFEDLAAGQRLIITSDTRSGEIRKIRVRAA